MKWCCAISSFSKLLSQEAEDKKNHERQPLVNLENPCTALSNISSFFTKATIINLSSLFSYFTVARRRAIPPPIQHNQLAFILYNASNGKEKLELERRCQRRFMMFRYAEMKSHDMSCSVGRFRYTERGCKT